VHKRDEDSARQLLGATNGEPNDQEDDGDF
jgi:hypothetical protein